MSNIVVFGAGGKAGIAVVKEALDRGHGVTAVVRDPAKYEALAATGAKVVPGDIRDEDAVTKIAQGHDAAVHAAAPSDTEPAEFFKAAATALLTGLPRAGVGRLVAIGIASTLEVAPGVRMMDGPEFPEAYKPFSNAHAGALEVYAAAQGDTDWVVLVPPVAFDAEAPRTGTYRIGGQSLLTAADGQSHIAYGDFAIAVVDEIDNPKHSKIRVAVAD